MAQFDQFSQASIQSTKGDNSSGGHKNLSERLIVVADGATTVGSGIIPELLREGAIVVAPLAREEQIEKLIADCAGVPTEHLFPKVVDLLDEEGMAALFEEVQKEHKKPVDHCISTQGGFWDAGPMTEQPLSEFTRVLAESSARHFVFAKHGLPALKKAHSSSFVFLSEGAGKKALSPDTSLYTISAACTFGVIKAAQSEFAEEPFRVNEMRLFSVFKRHSDVGAHNYTDFYGKKAFSSRKVGRLVVEMLIASKKNEGLEVTPDRLDGNALTV